MVAAARQDPQDRSDAAANREAVLAIVGPLDPEDGLLACALRREAALAFDAHVLPLIRQHWPDMEHGRFFKKMRIAVEDIYAAGPYCAVLLSPRAPRAVRALRSVGQALALSPRTFAWLLERAMPFVARASFPVARRRILLMAAHIAVADEALDEHFLDVPVLQRGAAFRALMHAQRTPTSPAQALVAAIVEELRVGLTPEESAELERGVEMCCRWAEAEAKNLARVEDPTGWGWRKDGILGGPLGASWAVRDYVGAHGHEWMLAVSELVQMMDDLLDVDTDRAKGLTTPAHTGKWNADTLRESYARALELARAVARESGLGERYVEMAVRAFRFQMRDLADKMLSGVAA